MRPIPDTSYRRQRGVTLVELVIVVTLIPIIILGFILLLNSILIDSKRSAISAAYQADLGFAMDRIEHDVKYAAGFATEITPPHSDSNQPSGGWSYAGSGDNKRTLILVSPATTLAQGANTRSIVYTDDTFDCSTNMSYNPPLMYRSIYFLDGTTLYKRFLIDSTTDTCNGPGIQKQSCPTGYPDCGARDEIIAKDIREFSIDYYQARDDSPLPDQYTNPEQVSVADAVRIKITMTQPNNANPISESITLKTARVN